MLSISIKRWKFYKWTLYNSCILKKHQNLYQYKLYF